MECKIILYHNEQSDEIILYEALEHNEISRVNLFSEDWYKCSVVISRYDRPISSVELFLDEECIGYSSSPVYLSSKNQQKFVVSLKDEFGNNGKQIFLLYYDLVRLSIKVEFADKTSVKPNVFSSDYLLCFSRNAKGSENAEEFIKYLAEFDDDKINEWMFKWGNEKNDSFLDDLQKGDLKKSAFKSLRSYIQLLDTVFVCYKDMFPLFKNNIRYKIVKQNALKPFDKIRNINAGSLQWLFQNTGQLAEVTDATSVQINGKNYLPFKISVEESINDFDIYENRVVSGFLLLVYKNAKYIEDQLKQSIAEESRTIEKMRGMEREGFYAPIITVKETQLNNILKLLEKLRVLMQGIAYQHRKYAEIGINLNYPIKDIPKKTKNFQEVRPYRLVFEQIINWYKFGDFSLAKENLIFNARTLDKLFEYYCLCQLLIMLKKHGFDGTSKNYTYKRNGLYNNPVGYDGSVANTYFLKYKNTHITLYYQPVISTDILENNITLFRTTSKNNYYTPDFLFKIWDDRNINENIGIHDGVMYIAGAQYLIFDAKYSTRDTIKNYYFNKTVFQYACELSDIYEQPIKMVWLLQGRPDGTSSIEKYHTSPLSQKYKPSISYGIASVNSKNGTTKLWSEIYSVIKGLT